jgi:hypothetical protein
MATKRKRKVMKRTVAEPEVTITVLRGVEGYAIYVNNYRVAGRKPWGGGDVLYHVWVSKKDMATALKRIV